MMGEAKVVERLLQDAADKQKLTIEARTR